MKHPSKLWVSRGLGGVFYEETIHNGGDFRFGGLLHVPVCHLAEPAAAARAKLIRLHVVANSDTAEDQRVKLLVRDAVLRAAADALEEETDPEAALQNGLPTIEQAANETLCRLGSGDTAKVSLRRELFPTRDYETFRLPAGVYRTLRVTIGTGEGHNWWCVVFPALCLPANAKDLEAVCEAAGFTEGGNFCSDRGDQ